MVISTFQKDYELLSWNEQGEITQIEGMLTIAFLVISPCSHKDYWKQLYVIIKILYRVNMSNYISEDGLVINDIVVKKEITEEEEIELLKRSLIDSFEGGEFKLFHPHHKKIFKKYKDNIDKIKKLESKLETIKTAHNLLKERFEKFEIDTLKSEKVEFKPLPDRPDADIKQILFYLKRVIEENYEVQSIGRAFEIGRESMRQLGVAATKTQQNKIWEMSKYANIYSKKELGYGLSIREKQELIQKIEEWLFEIEDEERKERERAERARLEIERIEREERERKEREKREKERLERERLEMERRERERLEQERLEKESARSGTLSLP